MRMRMLLPPSFPHLLSLHGDSPFHPLSPRTMVRVLHSQPTHSNPPFFSRILCPLCVAAALAEHPTSTHP